MGDEGLEPTTFWVYIHCSFAMEAIAATGHAK
jgi:hypothetical protein